MDCMGCVDFSIHAVHDMMNTVAASGSSGPCRSMACATVHFGRAAVIVVGLRRAL